MFIQGDVLAFVSLLIGTCLSAWCLTIAYGLLFPGRSEVARQQLTDRPGACIGIGAAVVLLLGGLGIALLSAPAPLLKLVGWIVILCVLSTASVGLAGASRIVAGRMLSMAPEMNEYAALCRSAAFIIVGCILPIVGWFAFGPILFFAATGSGLRAVIGRSHSSMPSVEAA